MDKKSCIEDFNFIPEDRKQLVHQNKKLSIEKHLEIYLKGQNDWVDLISSEIQNGDVILDIGCGLGILDVILAKRFDKCHFYLLDRSEGDRKDGHGGYNKTADDFLTRTQISLTRDFLVRNGVDPSRFTVIDVSQYDSLDVIPIDKLDVVLSKMSWCFHYPYLTYSDWCYRNMKSSGKLLIDVRNNRFPVEKYRVLQKGKKHETIVIEHQDMGFDRV